MTQTTSEILAISGLTEDIPHLIGLEIADLGPISLPLNDIQTNYLLKNITRSRFELDSSRFTIKQPRWQEHLSHLVQNVAKRLLGSSGSPTKSIEARLDRLVIVQAGNEENNTSIGDKCAVATLVLQLPSRYSGGEIMVIRNDENEMDKQKRMSFDLGQADAMCEFGIFYCAFYANAKFEWMRVTSGSALCLVYSLSWKNVPPMKIPAINGSTNNENMFSHRLIPSDYPLNLIERDERVKNEFNSIIETHNAFLCSLPDNVVITRIRSNTHSSLDAKQWKSSLILELERFKTKNLKAYQIASKNVQIELWPGVQNIVSKLSDKLLITWYDNRMSITCYGLIAEVNELEKKVNQHIFEKHSEPIHKKEIKVMRSWQIHYLKAFESVIMLCLKKIDSNLELKVGEDMVIIFGKTSSMNLASDELIGIIKSIKKEQLELETNLVCYFENNLETLDMFFKQNGLSVIAFKSNYTENTTIMAIGRDQEQLSRCLSLIKSHFQSIEYNVDESNSVELDGPNSPFQRFLQSRIDFLRANGTEKMQSVLIKNRLIVGVGEVEVIKNLMTEIEMFFGLNKILTTEIVYDIETLRYIEIVASQKLYNLNEKVRRELNIRNPVEFCHTAAVPCVKILSNNTFFDRYARLLNICIEQRITEDLVLKSRDDVLDLFKEKKFADDLRAIERTTNCLVIIPNANKNPNQLPTILNKKKSTNQKRRKCFDEIIDLTDEVDDRLVEEEQQNFVYHNYQLGYECQVKAVQDVTPYMNLLEAKLDLLLMPNVDDNSMEQDEISALDSLVAQCYNFLNECENNRFKRVAFVFQDQHEINLSLVMQTIVHNVYQILSQQNAKVFDEIYFVNRNISLMRNYLLDNFVVTSETIFAEIEQLYECEDEMVPEFVLDNVKIVEDDVIPVVFTLVSDDTDNIRKCRQAIEAIVDKEVQISEVTENYLNGMDKGIIAKLEELCRNHRTKFKWNFDQNKIKLWGRHKNVTRTFEEICKAIAEMARTREVNAQAQLISHKVQWKVFKNNTWMPFNIFLNNELETKYQHQQNSKEKLLVHLMDEQNAYFMADVQNKCLVYDADPKKTRYDLVRADMELSRINFELPPAWTPHQHLHMVDLHNSTAEYNHVVDLAKSKGLRGYIRNIISVKRIQNKRLYIQYRSFREDYNNKYGANVDFEKTVFHGTSESCVENIWKTGFNRSYAGKNAIAYGQGVYFATNSSYSHNYTDLKKGGNAVGHMFVCKVLVGKVAFGNPSMKLPPSDADTTVDNPAAPTIFVIYQDAQAYPEYLITYQ